MLEGPGPSKTRCGGWKEDIFLREVAATAMMILEFWVTHFTEACGT
jgi:hypothetical protein